MVQASEYLNISCNKKYDKGDCYTKAGETLHFQVLYAEPIGSNYTYSIFNLIRPHSSARAIENVLTLVFCSINKKLVTLCFRCTKVFDGEHFHTEKDVFFGGSFNLFDEYLDPRFHRIRQQTFDAHGTDDPEVIVQHYRPYFSQIEAFSKYRLAGGPKVKKSN
jgi:hypothetical protein